MLKHWTALAVALFLCISIAEAQGLRNRKGVRTARPNFSGVWEFDAEESIKNKIGSMFSANIKNLVSVMTVKHAEPLIEFIDNEEFELTNGPQSGRQTRETKSKYFTDGRGEVNVLGIEYITKTYWVGKKLVIIAYSTAGKKEPVSRTFIELSADGNRLLKRYSLIASNKKEEKELEAFGAVTAYKRRNK